VLRMVRDVVQVANKAGIRVAMCGEMAGDPLYIPVLLGLGVEEFSMNPTSIPVVKRVIRMTALDEAREIALLVLKRATVEEVNEYVSREMDHRFPDIFRFGRPLVTNRPL
jgi:phosphotransferase system enzyme I (PtsI)